MPPLGMENMIAPPNRERRSTARSSFIWRLHLRSVVNQPRMVASLLNLLNYCAHVTFGEAWT